jgi:hypothetical protein
MLDGLLMRFSSSANPFGALYCDGRYVNLHAPETAEVQRPLHGLVVSTKSQLNGFGLRWNRSGQLIGWSGLIDLFVGQPGTEPVRVGFFVNDRRSFVVGHRKGQPVCSAEVTPIPSLKALPLVIFGGRHLQTYIGQAWMRLVTPKKTGWTALISFGKTADFHA